MLKNRISYFFIILASIALLLFYHNFFFFYLLVVIILLPIISISIGKLVSDKVSVDISVPVTSMGSGNDIPIEFIIDNQSRFPMPAIKFGFSVENHFYPNDEIQEITLPLRRGKNKYGWSINSVYAGKICFKGESTAMQDYLGLYIFKKDQLIECDVTVLPKQSDVIMNVIESTMVEGDDQEKDSGNAIEDVTQVKEFREYVPGDRLQKVNWKISAKHDNLFVKEFEQEYNQTLTMLVELRRDRNETGSLDELITAFYSAALKLVDMDIRFRVQWYDVQTSRFLTETVSDPDSLEDTISQMYLMSSYDKYYAFEHYKENEHKRNDMAIYFTSPSFEGYDESKRIGTYKERVALICL